MCAGWVLNWTTGVYYINCTTPLYENRLYCPRDIIGPERRSGPSGTSGMRSNVPAPVPSRPNISMVELEDALCRLQRQQKIDMVVKPGKMVEIELRSQLREALEGLKRLLDSGVLTQDEFGQKKEQFLARI